RPAGRRVRYRSWRVPAFEFAEAAVVVGGVVPLGGGIAAGDDAARAAVAEPGRVDGVFPVVAARALGQQALAVLEHGAVLAVREGAAAIDQGEGGVGFGRQ